MKRKKYLFAELDCLIFFLSFQTEYEDLRAHYFLNLFIIFF